MNPAQRRAGSRRKPAGGGENESWRGETRISSAGSAAVAGETPRRRRQAALERPGEDVKAITRM
jgi:hypothetical protein